jgi:hypothetical protein
MPSPRLSRSSHRALASAPAAALLALATLVSAAGAQPDEPGWPREFDSDGASFVIYQPQPEDLSGDRLTGRAAFSLKKEGDVYPVYGVLWFTERIEVDRDSSTVTARGFDVTRVRLPSITKEQESRYERLVEEQAATWDLTGTLDELQAGLAAAEKERASIAGLDNTPPRILFHDRRAILVVYDGPPDLEAIEGTDLERVANTPCAVVFNPMDRTYYLNGANLWYSASDPLGPWSDIPGPPLAVRDAVPPDTSSYDQVEGLPPEVLTATEPTELISTDGPPRYAPLVDDELLYVTNTESDVIREVSTQSLYVLLSGRWYRAPSTDGPWTFVRGDSLPESFQQIPPDSPKGHVLASVAGTDQAEDALADAEIPQTSAIRRGDSDFEVVYDGEPQFEPIEGTDLQYAVNTDAEVIFADGRYYACDQGVWYISDNPDGPWSVSDTRPLGLEDIPPSCPVYDVRYVYIYDATPEVVYVGYTPGYLGCYPYYGTVVYGTGYRYQAWRGRHRYFPRRFTWGFHARYNPWLSRWSFGFSYGVAFFRAGSRWHPGHPDDRTRVRSMWFGPGGYHRPFVARDMTLLRTRRSRRAQASLPDRLPANLYSRPGNVVRVDRTSARTPVGTIARRIVRPVPVPNDVFAGKDGKVYRRDSKGAWHVREGTKWTPTKLPSPPPAAPAGRATEQRPTVRPARPVTPTPAERPSAGTPSGTRERPAQPPQQERPAQPPQQERPAQPPQQERPAQPPRQERPAPPPARPSPGNLEREYRARERSGREEKPSPTPPSARPAPPRQEPQEEKAKETPRETPRDKAQEPAREDEKRGRGR